MTTLAGKRIAVLMGGPGSERAVSFATGAGVARALRSLGAEVDEIDVQGADFRLPERVDLAFIALHGTFGEDGQVQQILQDRGVAYTGDGVEESRVAFDKIRSKEKFREHDVPTPEWEIIAADGAPKITLPLVIKAPCQGSSVGIYIVKCAEDLAPSLKEAAGFSRELLIEKFVAGRELTVGVLGDEALPILEIIPKDGVYDFNNKYPFLNPLAGGGAQHVCPAPLAPELTDRIQKIALAAHRSLGLRVYSRVDVLLTADDEPFVLEVNTIPGMTEVSLLPEAAAAAGISYPNLCLRIIQLSQEKQGGATK